MVDYDVIVIGAGAAGVATAALLQSRGYETLLVEGQQDAGGRSSTFEYRGYTVDTGSHQLASFSSSGMQALVDDVGAEIELQAVEPSLVHYDLSTGDLTSATARERFPSPEAYESFKEFVETTASMEPTAIARLHDRTAVDWLEDNVDCDALRSFFKRITGFGGAPLDAVSAGAFLETLHDSFTSEQTIQYPARGGIQQFPASVLSAFQRQGGETAFGVDINEITVHNGAVTGVSGVHRRPGLTMTVDISADRVVSTIPISTLFNIFPRQETTTTFVETVTGLRNEAIVYGSVFAGVEHELLERVFGDSDLQHFQVTVEPSPPLQNRLEDDWHALLTVPTYVNPRQAPTGYDLIYLEVHVPIDSRQRTVAETYQNAGLALLRALWPDFDDKVDWYHRVVEPNVLLLPPRQGLTGKHRPGFSVPGVAGMYLAGDGAYASGSGIGSAVKSAWGATRAVMRDDDRPYEGPLEPYLAVSGPEVN